MNHSDKHQEEWDVKSREFYEKLVDFCEEMYLDEPHILEEAIGILGIHIRECNKNAEIEDAVDDFIAELEEL